YQVVRRRQRPDSAEEGLRRMHEPHGEVLVERERGQLGERGIVGQERLYLRRKGELPSTLGVKQRLLTKMVARYQQAAPGSVPDRKGEHSAEPGDHSLAVLLVEMHQRFGIAAGLEPVAL